MDGNVLARRIASQSGRGLLTGKKNCFSRNLFVDLIAFAVQYVPIGRGAVGSVFPARFGSNFRIMDGSASGPGRTFKAFLGSARFGSHFQIKYGSGSVPCSIFTGLFGFGYEFLDP